MSSDWTSAEHEWSGTAYFIFVRAAMRQIIHVSTMRLQQPTANASVADGPHLSVTRLRLMVTRL